MQLALQNTISKIYEPFLFFSILHFSSLSSSCILTLVVLVLIMKLLSLRTLPVIYHGDDFFSLTRQTMNLRLDWDVGFCKRCCKLKLGDRDAILFLSVFEQTEKILRPILNLLQFCFGLRFLLGRWSEVFCVNDKNAVAKAMGGSPVKTGWRQDYNNITKIHTTLLKRQPK